MTQKIKTQDAFSNTSIKTPFEKMRARAIVNASLNAQGLSLINFNLTAFLSRPNDATLILCLWAIEPIQQYSEKFRQHPQEGENALIDRVHNLAIHLQKRSDLPQNFLEHAQAQMKEAITKEMAYILQSVA